MAMLQSKKEEEKKQTRYITQRYRDRLKVLRLGQEYSQKDDIPNAVKAYIKYLQALSLYFEVEEKNLTPDIFKRDENIVEIMLISQVYWDLAKAYDRAPRLTKESERCLGQFVLFSLGFKFQYLNSEMLRKFLKKRNAHNQKLFENAYEKMKISSNKCYIATYCYGENHEVVQNLRLFKKNIQKHPLGLSFIDYYYQFSPKLIELCSKFALVKRITILFFSPCLLFFSKLCKKFIITR